MIDDMEVTIEKKKVGSASVVIIDTEFSLKQCHLTKKYEAKVVTDSGVTHITEPLIEPGNYICIITKNTRYSYKLIFLKAQNREDIIV